MAAVKSARFIEQEAQHVREVARLQQVKLAKQVQDDRKKTEERTDREAAKEAEDAWKQKEADEKRVANLTRSKGFKPWPASKFEPIWS